MLTHAVAVEGNVSSTLHPTSMLTWRQNIANEVLTIIIFGGITFCIICIFCLFVIGRLKKERGRRETNQRNLSVFTTSHNNDCKDPDSIEHSIEMPDALTTAPNNLEGPHQQLDSTSCITKEVHSMGITTKSDSNVDHLEGHKAIDLWLKTVIGFPQYFNNFIQAGYDSIEFIKEIANIQELHEIGITSNKDCEMILNGIQRLKPVHSCESNVAEHNETVQNDLANQGLPTEVQIVDAVNGSQTLEDWDIIQDIELLNTDEIIIMAEDETPYKETLDCNEDVVHIKTSMNDKKIVPMIFADVDLSTTSSDDIETANVTTGER